MANGRWGNVNVYGGGLFGGFRRRINEGNTQITRDIMDASRMMNILQAADERKLLPKRKKKLDQELALGDIEYATAAYELASAPGQLQLQQELAKAKDKRGQEYLKLKEKEIDARIESYKKMQVIPAGGIGVKDGKIVARAPRRSGGKTIKTMNPATRIKLKTQQANLEMGIALVSQMHALVAPENVGPEGALRRGTDWVHAAFEGKNIAGYKIPPDADRRATMLQDLVDRFTQENWKELVGPGGLTASDLARLEKATKTGIRGSAPSARNAFRGILETFQKRKQVLDEEMRLGTVTTIEGDVGELTRQDIMNMSDEEFDAFEAAFESGEM